MTQDMLVTVMTGAVVVCAVALVLQMLMLLGMYKAVSALKEQVAGFLPRAETAIATTERTVAEHSAQLKELSTKAMEVVETAQKQLVRVDDVLGDAAGKAKSQLERMEMIIDDTMSRVHHTVIQLNNGVLKPVKEINGVAAGVRAALDTLVRGKRPNPAQATADEEMFI